MAPVPPSASEPPPSRPGMGQGHDSLLRNIGAFFGHVVGAITSDPAPPQPPAAGPTTMDAGSAQAEPTRVVREQVEERLHVAPGGEKYLLRRRVIDEVEIVPPRPSGGAS